MLPKCRKSQENNQEEQPRKLIKLNENFSNEEDEV